MKKLIYLQGQQEHPSVDHIQFPTGEKHIRIRGLKPSDDVILCYNDPSGDLMKLGMAVDICRRADVVSIKCVMPFVPYARQDEVYVDGDPLSIQVFARFVNSLGLTKIFVTDPHSKVTPGVLDRCEVIPQHLVSQVAAIELDDMIRTPIALVAPDLGAAKKIKSLHMHLTSQGYGHLSVIQCDKTRDPATGRITGFKILDGDPTGKHCLMVDDICDGGGTFAGLFEVIRDAGASGQSLCVTHGIFSRGAEWLLKRFDYIYASDSFPKVEGVKTILLGEPV